MIHDLERLAAAWPLLLMVLVGTLVLLTAFFGAVHLGTQRRAEWMGFFFAAVPLALALGVLAGGRNLNLEKLAAMAVDPNDAASGFWVTRVVTLIALFIALERGVRFIMSGEFRQARGYAPLLGLMGFVLAANILAAFLGARGGFTHHHLYAPIVALGVFAYAQHNLANGLAVVRNTLFAFLLASLMALLVHRDLVAETGYGAGLLPGLTVRFYGFATHPNTLAPLCLLLLCCLRLRPFAQRWLNLVGMAVLVVSLLLTQSKTSLLLVAGMGAYFWWLDRSQATSQVGRRAHQHWHLQAVAAGVGLSALVLGALLLSLLFSDSAPQKFLGMVDRLQIGTLTGRTTIWEATLRAVETNWLFGYGPGLWGVEFRVRTGLMFTHAHNQYMQTLGAAGVVGLGALIAYLVLLGRAAWRTRQRSRGVTWALFVFLVLRGLAEVPLAIGSAMQTEYVVQMFLLMVCVGCLREAADRPAALSGSRAAPRATPAVAVPAAAWRARG